MINNFQLKNQITNDIKQVFPNLDINSKISFNKYSMKNQMRVYKNLFFFVFEFLGMRESEYEIFKSRNYTDILYKVAEVLIISQSLRESKNKDASFLKEKELYYSSKFGKEIYGRFCKEHNLFPQDSE